ncbi:diguanylate cyclase [Novosphingobium sp. CF614]|uniref:sensor domain-containing diguanylate cyclase n=1 Tax=Novosphingobium sp. CF614 TaxID=1884364 RepID=UPI001C42F259|nr:diguanylate cyclase [Novosphingobium sp. CF614]
MPHAQDLDAASVPSLYYVTAMSKLVEVVQQLSLARNLGQIMEIVRCAARDLTGADGATFVLQENGECYYAEEYAIAPLWKGRRFPMDICLSGWVMQHRQSTVVEDVYNDPRIPVEAYRPTFVRSLAMVPIRTVDPLGAIGNYWARTYRPSDEQLSILQALADTTAVAMEHVQLFNELETRVEQRTSELAEANRKLLYEVAERQKAEEEIRRLSLTDELTGLYNRRGFSMLGKHDFALAERSRAKVLMMAVDLDGLKRVNDTMGHDAGDRLIRGAARALQATFRKTDTVARLGGDEFAVLCVNYPDDDTDRLRGRLASNIALVAAEEGIDLAMSIGFVWYDWTSTVSFEQLLRTADEIMYDDKRAKRWNQART